MAHDEQWLFLRAFGQTAGNACNQTLAATEFAAAGVDLGTCDGKTDARSRFVSRSTG